MTPQGREPKGYADRPTNWPMATVETIYTTPEGSAPMEEVEKIEAVERQGLRGDRYMEGTGYYSGMDECEVTLIESEAIADIRDEYDIDLSDGRHRRNIVTKGIEVYDLLDRFTAYPVQNETRWTDGQGNVLPDAFLLSRGSTPKDLAYAVHSDIGEGYLHAVDARSNRRIGEGKELGEGDVIKIVSTAT